MYYKNKNCQFSFLKLTLLILFLFIHRSYAQQVPCAFDRHKTANSLFIQQAETQISHSLRRTVLQQHQTHDSIFKIPVVVHVIHNGGVENISDAQIQSQINVLNEDFRKITGTNGDGNGVDTEIEFCLARIDPDGDCTNGIVRIKSLLTNHDSYERPQLSQLSSWDPTRYLNVYVVKTMAGGTLGYASFPGGPASQDGVVMVHNAFGRLGTALAPNNLGRTCSHECGHWFGLYHTFNGGCGTDTCSDGDLVCDTPPVVNPNFNCPAINTCHNDVPDINDQVQNYMDYTNDACKSMFTAGQRERMHATLYTLRYDIWQPANSTSTGCDSGFVSPPCNVVADFIANGTSICPNNTVTFTNKTLNNPTSFQWSFPGGNPATDTTLNPTVTYSSLGTFDVTLIATGTLGSDTLLLTNYINVAPPPTGLSIPYDETFEQPAFPPNGIVIDNPDNGITWERDTGAVMFEGLASAKINNLINTNYGQVDALILPSYDLTTFTGTPYLTFRWAYARSDANYSDELLVLLSTNCGLTFNQVFYRTGSAMATGPTQTTPYLPDINTIWKQARINLNPYIAFSNVIIKIVNVTDGGNNLYIDSLHVGSILPTAVDELLVEAVKIFPNPFGSELTIELPDLNGEKVVLTLFDAFGRTIDARTIQNNSGKQTIHWRPVVGSEKSLFLLEIKTNELTLRKKIIHLSGIRK